MTPPERSTRAAQPASLRADAERNRQKILEVAARVFAERGIDATLNDIAHEAGVGVGTVYRKFPDKNALIEQLTEQKLRHVLDQVHQISADAPAGDALRAALLAAGALRASDRGLFQILLTATPGSPQRESAATSVLHAWDDLVARAVRDGAVRPGFSVVDIDLFMIMVGAVADATHSFDPHAWERCAHVLLDGFTARVGQGELVELDVDDDTRRAIFLNR